MKKLFPLLLLIGVLTGCTKNFESINTNPNAPDKVTSPGLLLPNIIRSTANDNINNAFNRGSIVADQMASSYASNFANWTRAEATSYFSWNSYNYIRDLNTMIKVSEEQGLNTYKGIALVLRCLLFQNLTDIYGPIPFREASLVTNNIATPKYAQQQEVYAGLISDLEEAATLLGNTAENITGDILFNGDVTRWKKFNTALMLRLLLRQSNKVDPTTKMAAVLGNATLYPLFSSHADQVALQYLNDRNENNMPLYHKSNSDYSISQRVSKRMVDYLKRMNDTRLYVFAIPASATNEYAGSMNGTGDWDNPNSYSPPGMLWAPRTYNATLASTVAAQSVLLSYSEQQFILAEAAERGYITGGSVVAETYYKNGIASQFSYYAGLIPSSYTFPTAADIEVGNTYYEQDAVAYTGTASEKLEKIWLQKWLALFMTGYESWSEYRRTGFPAIVAGPVSTGYVPQRCLYPADEQRINKSNYDQAVQWLGQDELSTKLWWAK